MEYGVFEGKKFDERHGGPFDRGSADSYYGRQRDPHFYVEGTGTSERIEYLTVDELEAYNAGYDWNERYGDKKDYE